MFLADNMVHCICGHYQITLEYSMPVGRNKGESVNPVTMNAETTDEMSTAEAANLLEFKPNYTEILEPRDYSIHAPGGDDEYDFDDEVDPED